ncbi:4'-phosphopantetheinyl transferase superfamily protein, partial [Alphaproteobacteria bacterium]|nr:4'-phosphopantetheinyl transferase superfamily protein [Alphaproteobacteria bacterium]
MIIGIGTDILDVRRISNILYKYDQSFINRIYGSNEIKILKNKSKTINLFLGKRFAAKEATWKALNPN